MRYAVIGTGAIGGFYGGHLARVGCNVHFLLRSDYEHVRAHGLRVDSVRGDFHLAQVHAYNSVHDMPRADVVLVALKTTQNHLLGDLLPPLLHENTLVVPLQNGLDIEAELAQIVPAHTIMGGLCFIYSEKIAPGHIVHADTGRLSLGAYRAEWDQRMQTVFDDFQRTTIPTTVVPNLAEARWRKLVWNIPFNGLSVILNANTTEMLRDPDMRTLISELMQNVLTAAEANGHLIEPEFVQNMLLSTEKMKPYAPSMKVDYDQNRPMELAAIYGNTLRNARAHGLALPQINTIYQQLKFLQRS